MTEFWQSAVDLHRDFWSLILLALMCEMGS